MKKIRLEQSETLAVDDFSMKQIGIGGYS